nr:UPF0175 family protein [Candidatus Njordarchaeota archaeon]
MPEDLLEEIEFIEKEENSDRSTVLRKLISVGVKLWKLDHALSLYRDRKVTTWKAADIAGVSLYEFIEVLREKRIPAQYTVEDLEADLRGLT